MAKEEMRRLAEEEAKKKAEKDAQKRAEFQAWWQANLERKVSEGADSAKGGTGREAQAQGVWYGTI